MFAVLVVAAVAALGPIEWARSHAEAVTDLDASQTARTHLGLLSSELQKYRLLPLVLIEYPDVAAALETGSPEAAARLNPKLEILAERTNAAVIYVLRPDGRTIAASNWRLPTSFVGQNYSYRPYFLDALRDGSAELFALGTVSGRPGLFIAQRVTSGGRTLGVIVVKVEFVGLEETWARQAGPTFVTDRNGVIIITSVPEWRFRTLRPLDRAARERLRASRQFGNLDLKPLDLSVHGRTVRQGSGADEVLWRMAQVDAPMEGGALHYLQPLAPALASANASARALALAGVVVALLVAGYWWRVRERSAMQREARANLEREVALRTLELTDANRRLQEESFEREQADARSRAAREELAQANRLSYIGQITAGVAHEINQPVAAIRTFAENGQKFLERGNTDRALGNLSTIVDLTARIGEITAELRGFSRRGAKGCERVAVATAINGALLLTRDRIRSAGIALECEGYDERIEVLADRIRLEQVLVNLIQNAIEALGETDAPRITISVIDGSKEVRLLVADNGPGVPAELVDELFTPFVTGRPDGLGLGLGIARDIAREFGGDLLLVDSTAWGTTFELKLRPA